ncbi:PREDICTED: RING-H2 finger protein ATL8-like [Erythranthe guttata]|nr:PREDICTED: RING-H2 finger protein ATL8-like [Erythranthe guttata]|eukprot:XP_012846683.1 PREDICTED: RING-H2 finger protein ATL8-like [Erythranthe guttata]
MPDSAIDSLVSGAIEFSKHCSVDDDDLLVIPVVVDLDVCTVQLKRETIDEAYGRAIRSECLMNLGKVRVEDVDLGLSLMETCPICLIDPTVGDQISVLPFGHAFHNHCIVQWLINSNSCPSCRLRFDSN